LDRVFASANGVYEFNIDDFEYNLLTTTHAWSPPSTLCPFSTRDAGTATTYCGIPPQVKGVETSNAFDVVSPINKYVDGNPVIKNGQRAEIRFYAKADDNQMPITKIAVDTGDGSDIWVKENVLLKNRWDDCDDTSFGTSESGCMDDSYFAMTHVYAYKNDLPSCDSSINIEDNCEKNMVIDGVNQTVNIYKPRIQVQDNWGWCTGSCHTNGGQSGCFKSEFLDECNTASNESWVNFDKQIIVIQ
jgi:hypothetical protein